MLTQEQYNVCKQIIRNQTIKINLLNFNMQTVDELSGNVISGSITIDATSSLRRSCNISLVVTDSSFDIQPGGKIWLDKFIQILVGIDDVMSGNTVWFNYGIYLIDTPTWVYDAVTNTLSFQGLDLMSKMTGLRNGYLDGIPTKIPQGSSVRDSMIAVVTQLGGFQKYSIDECKLKSGAIQDVPYDIVIDQGGTVYDILEALLNILPSYQIYFDVDGTFIYNKIPTGEDEPVVADDDIFVDNLLSENIVTDFSSVKNITEVYGRAKDPSYYSSNTTVSNDTYTLTIAEVQSYTDNIMYGFTAPSIVANPKAKINSLESLPIVLMDGTSAVIPKADEYYVILYQQKSNDFLFLGHQQSYGIAKDINPNSPFYINSSIGEIRQVLYGGEYDNIFSDELAQQRADYENWKSTRLNDTISLTSVPIHFLDVNTVIEHSIKGSAEKEKYIIKSLSVDLAEIGTQSISAIKYYPLYPTI